MKEIWKSVVGYEGLYEVSNLGRVKSLDMVLPYARHGKITIRIRKGVILTPAKMRNGYLRVGVSNNGKHKLNLVHRLVAMAFIPNYNNYREVNHKNCDKSDNRVVNLEWVNSSQNKIHAIENNLYTNNKVVLQIKDGVVINEYKSTKEAERQTGIFYQSISKVALGKRNKAGGYQWRYK